MEESGFSVGAGSTKAIRCGSRVLLFIVLLWIGDSSGFAQNVSNLDFRGDGACEDFILDSTKMLGSSFVVSSYRNYGEFSAQIVVNSFRYRDADDGNGESHAGKLVVSLWDSTPGGLPNTPILHLTGPDFHNLGTEALEPWKAGVTAFKDPGFDAFPSGVKLWLVMRVEGGADLEVGIGRTSDHRRTVRVSGWDLANETVWVEDGTPFVGGADGCVTLMSVSLQVPEPSCSSLAFVLLVVGMTMGFFPGRGFTTLQRSEGLHGSQRGTGNCF